MKKNFWEKMQKPFFVLAPMADVTDFAQRQMLVKYGKPDVLYTEFVSADGLASEKGRKALLRDMRFEENEHPIVAQIFGANPENIKKATEILCELGFDGIEINMGCPDRSVEKQGAGSALMKNPKLARELIRAAKAGAGEIPISVKTRLGYNKNEIETWLPEILAEQPAVLTVHLRTRKEMSEVAAHWELAPRIAALAREHGVIIVGNGDVQSLQDGKQKAKDSGMDGIMVGRGIFGNPWFFNKKISIDDIPLSERFAVMIEHAKLFEKELASKKIKGFHVMKKHFKAYVGGFDGAKELRAKLMETESVKEVEDIVSGYFNK
ncbi:MAG: tRNA-dihydrouridine synthase [Candidatus Moranbacteria bacterium]|nr:tRNA-dihydrouridine synthase [Candidatus Moranbacteria bacterium]